MTIRDLIREFIRLDRSSKATPVASEARVEYFGLLGLDPASEADAKLREGALRRAYELRTFEIEHYWKRATYFWAFQVAIFAAFGLLKPDNSLHWDPLPVAVAALGVLTATANMLSAKGSKFWQANWEAHIDMLEDEFEGRLHKTIKLTGGKASYSVSRLNLVLTHCFVVFWILMFVYAIFSIIPPLLPWQPIPRETASVIWVGGAIMAVGFGACLLFAQKTSLDSRESRWISRRP
jgi:hypothetical protein